MAIKNAQKIKKRIEEEEDFIYCPRLKNSLNALVQKNPMGIDNERIAKVMLITEEEVEELYNSAVEKIKRGLSL